MEINLRKINYFNKLISGYTIIELLIVIVITAMLFGIGYTNYRQFARNQALLATANKLKTDIRLAQQLALTSDKPTAGCSVLTGYNFNIDTANRRYAIYPVCGGVPLGTAVKDELIDSGVTTVAVSPVNPIYFKVLGQGTNIPAGSQVTITLTQGVTLVTKTIVVTSSGEII